MTEGGKTRGGRALATRLASADYDVGYAKPPASIQFKPGTSGNPRGPPKGTRNKLPALNEERMKNIIIRRPTGPSRCATAPVTSRCRSPRR